MTYFANKLEKAIKGTTVEASINTFCWLHALETKKQVEDFNVRCELRIHAEKHINYQSQVRK